MPRKPAIILLILLLIGGGAVAFSLHLRSQSIPPSDEVGAFLVVVPPFHGWELDVSGRQSLSYKNRASWIQSLSPFGGGQIISTWEYRFRRGDSAEVRVTFNEVLGEENAEGEVPRRIDSIAIHGDPADAGEFAKLLLEKFPNLRHVLQVNP